MLPLSTITNCVVGCVLGGAVGDALVVPFEGLWSHSIPDTPTLLSGFAEYEGYPRGQYTDDTQLTIATLQSIIRVGGIDPEDIARRIARLWKSAAVVGPGGACTAAADRLLAGVPWTEAGAVIGQAGNGTAMRIAPLGLYFLSDPAELPGVVAQVSRITHQDPRSIAGGVAVASAARVLSSQPMVDAVGLCQAVATDMEAFHPTFAGLVARLPELLHGDRANLLDYIAWSGAPTREFDQVIITPYVIPTVLASLWAVVTYPQSWPEAVAAVIQLGGDVDTLGAIVGGLMGARLGVEAIPVHLRDGVLGANRLRALAIQYAQLIAQKRRGEA